MELRKGYKQTEVGVIPEDWEVTKLSGVIESNRNIRYGVVQPGMYDPNGCLMLRSQDYSKGWGNPDDMHRVNKTLEDQYKNARLIKGDLIITVVGAGIGQVVITPDWLDGAILSRSTARIAVDKAKAAKEYVLNCLISPIGARQILDIQKEGAQPVISCLDLAKFNMPFPSIKEQTAIATALSDMDKLIAGLEQLIEKKKAIKQGAMQELLRPKEGWVVKKLGEIFTFYPTSNYSKAEMSTDGDVGCIHYGLIHAIDNANFSLSKGVKYYISKEQAKYERVVDGDVIMVDASEDLIGLNKSIEISDAGSNEYIAGLHTFHLRDEKSFFVKNFRGLILNSTEVKKQMLRLAVGMKVFGVSKPQLQEILLPIPSSNEQISITATLCDMDSEIMALENSLSKHKLLKQGMMQELLTGKTRLL